MQPQIISMWRGHTDFDSLDLFSFRGSEVYPMSESSPFQPIVSDTNLLPVFQACQEPRTSGNARQVERNQELAQDFCLLHILAGFLSPKYGSIH